MNKRFIENILNFIQNIVFGFTNKF